MRSNLLLWIICRIGKKSWINAPLNTINAFDDNAIFACLNKIIIEEFTPHSVHKLTMAVCKDLLLLSAPFGVKG